MKCEFWIEIVTPVISWFGKSSVKSKFCILINVKIKLLPFHNGVTVFSDLIFNSIIKKERKKKYLEIVLLSVHIIVM